ncbi:hypothetical protein [Neotabrizicola shimadae]|uniref:Lipoprotein n=1 Tax=Neotabrizicola shimadae TaxID=2807096 RepID=A0A8G0ZUF3_9RHOB|nr:hypothetical protein [Neotabrizicola shimadae]QYZ70262.1 hypothetical protein JO391_01610 [Neotabrizicola shimadae]
MIGASKILTVSYGTFSCTLEGFDDPFNTMKAIAEYFRDLAAEDRFFGAEPPQPDPAMLHRIAEREMQRRVEARVQDNGVILRAEAEAAPAARLAEPAPAPVASPAVSPAEVVSPAVIPAPQAAAVTESVAAKLSKLRAAKAAPASVAEVALADEAEALLPDPGLADFMAAEKAVEHEAPAVVDPAAPALVEAEAPAAEVELPAVAEAATEEAVAEVAAEVAADVVADQAAVVETELAEVAEAEPAELAPVALALPEDLASELDDEAARALSDALGGSIDEEPAPAKAEPAHSIEELFPEGDALPDDVEDILPETEPVDLAGDLDLSALIASYGGDTDTMAAPAQPAAAADAATVDIDLESLIGNLADDSRSAEAEAAEMDGEIALTEPVEIEAVETELADVEGLDAEIAAAEVVEPEAEVAVVEVAAVEVSAVEVLDVAADEMAPLAEELAEAPEAEVTVAAATGATELDDVADEQTGEQAAELVPVRPEAGEKLQRARARVVRIRRADVEPSQAEPQAPAPQVQAEMAEPRRKLEVESDDAALNRLIAQTNTEMEGPDAKRRLSAIAHLKAAVAATVAERLTRGKPASTEAARAEPYRDDLARAVRPVRPEAPGLRGERPAPLVLVSEQRIDRPAPATPAQPPVHVSPVRPRRVTSAALAVQADDDDEDEEDSTSFADTRGFVEFADKLGVRSLPDLMEAAAAYTASVEGRPHFSRPHLIKHLSAARGVEIPREDSLRTFGRLLREGRIEKIKRGQFAVNEGSRFLTEARKING